VAPHLGCATSA